METIFVTYIYQPFFNILVGIYWLIGDLTGGQFDMGLAVIIFSLIVRIIMLPLDFFGGRSANDKLEIQNKIKQLEHDFKHDPVKLREETKKIIKASPGAIISEIIEIVIQVIIVLMLYRIFATGLEGADLHLLYSFMPNIPTPINLLFMGKFDLSVTNVTLNIIQSILIFVVEAMHMYFSPTPVSRKEFISLAIFLPLVSFFIFSLLPSGKKLFIITSLIFSVFINLVKQILYWYQLLSAKPKVVISETEAITAVK